MDKTKKKHIKRYFLWVVLAAFVAALAVMPLLAAPEEEETGPQASILTATVQKDSIEVSIKGGGTLSAGEATDVTLPSGVKIKSFLVSNGDVVTAGTPVAEVDRVSVMEAIVQVQETLDALQDQITDAQSDAIASTVYATAGGRVKQVFAQPGDSVAQVMLEHGALAVLSLDGMMAVSLERNTSLSAGDTVCVTRSDGSEISGRVESNLAGTIVITVVDAGYGVGEVVTVTTEDGDRIGSGKLYVHNAWKATGYSGTIKTVYAKEEKTVSDGSLLFSLTDTSFEGNLQSLSSLHREYEELLQSLFQMYETEVITAPCDGSVSGVDESSPYLLAADGQEQVWTLMLLSAVEEELCTGTDEDGSFCTAQEHVKGCYFYCTGLASCTAKQEDHKITCLTWCVSAKESGVCRALNHKADCIEKCEGAVETGKCPAAGVHKPGCIESCVSSDGSVDCPATGTHKADCIERCDKTETCFATVHHYDTCLSLCTGDSSCTALNHKSSCYMAKLVYKAYAAQVRQVGATELIVGADVETVYQIKNGENGWELVEPKALKTDLMITEQTVAVSDPSQFSVGDYVLFWTGYNGDTPEKYGEAIYHMPAGEGGQTGMLPGGSLDMSAIAGGSLTLGGMTGGSVPQSGEEEWYPLDGEVLLTVTDQTAMVLDITLDEQDISQVSLGQWAQVKITALKGEVYEATVTEVGAEGTNNGGSSKFILELTLPYQENMLSGMNATVTIPLYSKVDVLTLPVAALTEENGQTLVYTALDPETGEPAAAVEVTTGVSDGETVEILSGLQSGDTVYYSYYDTLELDHTAKAEQSGMFGR